MSASAYIASDVHSSRLRYGVRTDRGTRYRSKANEDNFFAIHGTLPAPSYRPFGLFVVADGMGGHGNGQMASSIVIQRMADIVIPRLLAGESRVHALLAEGVQNAHQAILQYNQQSGKSMGSLVTAALIIGETATIANVGDSRTYLYRPGQGLRQITMDHSLVASMVAAGIIGPEDVYTHPKRNEVHRALGVYDIPQVQVDIFRLVLQDGDKLLLCSDGVWEMVRDPEIERLMQLSMEDPASTANMLYEAAINGGGLDNIGVIVVEYGPQQIEVHTSPTLPMFQQNSHDTDSLNEDELNEALRPVTYYMPAISPEMLRKK
jgi:serine/threonine protein phosphatase PrpC